MDGCDVLNKRVSRFLRFQAKAARVLAKAAVGGTAAWSALALAQSVPVVSRPMVQALPNPANGRLGEALARLGRNPRDVAALMDAGDAARGMGDFDAAIGFYRRADEISPENPRIKAGFARAYVMNGDPVSAIPYFNAAEKDGVDLMQIAADRGLAYDLVGDNVTAQRYYATVPGSDETRMRMALSQAIGGDQKGAETTLMPLLRRQDKPGWRTRAFILAIGGDTKQAVSVANTILPPQLAENIAPYLRYMPRLTRAQQAAAANLGRFPRASEIGRDDSRIAAYVPARLAAADSALVPRGEPLDGSRSSRKKAKAAEVAAERARVAAVDTAQSSHGANARKAALASGDPDRVAPPEPRPAIESTGELPPVGNAGRPVPAVAAAAAPSKVSSATALKAVTTQQQNAPAPRAEAASSRPAPAVEKPAPGFDLARLQSPQPAAASTPVASAAPSPKAEATNPPAGTAPARRPSLSEIFAEFGKPTIQATPAAGAVDIRKITPLRPEPKADDKAAAKDKPAEKGKAKKPVPPAHPSRIWVQIGVGRDKDAIAFDWRRYARQAPKLFKGRQANVSEMGRTNRVLAGPFETQKAADEFVTALGKAGIEGAMPWTSPAGQVVDVLPAR